MLASLGKGMHLQCLGMGSELLRRAAGWGFTGRDLTSRVFQDGLPHHMQLHVRDVAQPRSAQGHEAFLSCIPECFAECLHEQWQQARQEVCLCHQRHACSSLGCWCRMLPTMWNARSIVAYK